MRLERHIPVALVAALALPASAPAARTLHRGDHGRAVIALQRALHLHADGTFGPATGRALRRFQRRHHLRPDGVAGAATWRALRSGGAHGAGRGSHVSAVRLLQRRLGISADGIFGSGTRRALKHFQRAHGMTADAIAGPATWHALGVRGHHAILRLRPARRTGARRHQRLRRHGARGGSVRLVQRRLGIATDGVFGPGTARAVRRFQRGRGLTADGVVGPATWRALGVGGHRPLLHRVHARSWRRAGGIPGVIFRAIAAANRIAGLPYRYGGGHGSFNDTGYDCSGSVSYVLHGIGRLSSPEDSTALMRFGAPGPGRWITIYANPGHAYMTILGRRYDTSAQSDTGSRWARLDRPSIGYVARHPAGL